MSDNRLTLFNTVKANTVAAAWTKVVTRTIVSDDEETLLVVHKPLNEDAGIHGNIALAAMTTAYARIALYKVTF